MLDGRRDGGGAVEFGGSDPMSAPSSRGGGGKNFELDDDIPF
jgi:hypothetical protein